MFFDNLQISINLIIKPIMHFNPYMHNRSGINGVSAANISHYLDNSNKNIPITSTTTPNNYLTTNKPIAIIQQTKIDIGRPNFSVNLFMNDFRKITQQSQSPSANGILYKPQTNYSQNYVTFHPSRHQLPDEQKYICLSPIKPNNRTSAGSMTQDTQQQPFQHTKNDSITQLKSQQIKNINYGANALRKTIDCPSSINSKHATTSHLQVNYVNSVNCLSETRSKMSEKDIKDTISFSYRDEQRNGGLKLGYSVRRPQKVATYFQGSGHLQKNNQTQADVERRKNLDNNTSKMRPLQESNYKNSVISAATESFMRKDSTQDLSSKKYSSGRMSQIDRSIQKDIQLLKFTSKKTEEILDRELAKNNYLDQFFQKRGAKTKGEERGIQQTRKQFAINNINLEGQVEEKSRQILQKNQELDIKSNAIIQKNRQLQAITSEYRLAKQQLQKRQSQWFQKQKSLQQKIKHLQKQLIQRTEIYESIKVSSFQKIQQQQQTIRLINTTIAEQKTQITAMNSKILMFQSQIYKISQHNKQLLRLKGQLQQSNAKYMQQIQQLCSLKQNALQKWQQSKKMSQQTINKYQQKTKNYQDKISELEAKSKQLNSTIQQYELHFKNKSNQIEKYSLIEDSAVSLNQRSNTLQKGRMELTKKRDQQNAKFNDPKSKYEQILKITQMQQDSDHQNLLIRIHQCLQTHPQPQQLQSKQLLKGQQHQIIKMQQQHFERRHQQLNRQLKRIGNRLVVANGQAQQSWCLLRDLNQQMVIFRLIGLNQKYREGSE